MAATTPIGTRWTKPSLPTPAELASSGIISPARVRATAAENRKVSTARSASTRAVRMGLAASVAMERANSSWRSARRSRGPVQDLGPLVGRQGAPTVTGQCHGHRRVEVGLGAHRHPARRARR